MNKNFLWKTIFIVAVTLVFVFMIFFGNDPGKSYTAMKQGGWKAGVQQNINLGLDLKGGTHLILQVQVNDAVNAETDRGIERLRDNLRSHNVPYADLSKPDPVNAPDKLVLKGVPPENGGDLRSIISDQLSTYDLASGPENSWTVTMKPAEVTAVKNNAVSQAIETIRNRIDQLGVSEPVIEEHGLGQYQILVQLPGVDDPARVKEIMQSTAMLEIRQALDNGRSYPSREELLAAHQGQIPSDAVVMPGRGNKNPETGETSGDLYYLLSRTPIVAGRDLRDAKPSRDQFGKPEVAFYLSAEGGKRFSQFTGSHVGDYLAIVLDGKVQQDGVAVIKSEIGDSGVIEGSFTDQQVKDLSMVLRSGALPAGIKYLEERTVGPSLGADSIRAGVRAAMVGFAAVLIFMLVYYRGAGINADLALVMNLIILLGFLSFSGATLTLPGIAGVILTVGMGVDSNVLIFERIREELRNGKSASQAVEQGFGHAWVTIVDTHVTTIVSAIILFIFGTGPVKGFAVTLTFGLLANLFTAVFVSRVIFDYELSKRRGKALSI
jgi:preprotein translocase subunit SecD